MSKYRKPATIVLLLLIYFTVLTMVSFMRTTESVAVGENLIDNQKFTVLAAENRAWSDGDYTLMIRRRLRKYSVRLFPCETASKFKCNLRQTALRNLPGHLCSWWICGQMVTIAQTRNFR